MWSEGSALQRVPGVFTPGLRAIDGRVKPHVSVLPGASGWKRSVCSRCCFRRVMIPLLNHTLTAEWCLVWPHYKRYWFERFTTETTPSVTVWISEIIPADTSGSVRATTFHHIQVAHCTMFFSFLLLLSLPHTRSLWLSQTALICVGCLSILRATEIYLATHFVHFCFISLHHLLLLFPSCVMTTTSSQFFVF